MSFFIRNFAPVMVQQIDIPLKPKRRAFYLLESENCNPDVRVDMETIFNRLMPENRPEYEYTLEGAF